LRIRFLLFVAAYALLLLLPTFPFVLRFGSIYSSVGDWVMAYYSLSYTGGFVRRGLIGTVVSLTGLPPKVLALWGTFAAALGTGILLYRLRSRWDILLLFLLSPATALHLGYDLGRYDHFNLLILALSLYILRRRRCAMLIPLLNLLAILIHEAYALYGLPTVLAAQFLMGRRRETYLSLLLSAFLLGALMLWGSPSSHHLNLPLSDVGRKALGILSLGTLETLRYNLQYILSEAPRRPWDFLLPILILSAYTLIYLRVVGRYVRGIVLFAPLSGVALFIFGYDYPRWTSLVVMVMFLYAAFILGNRDVETTRSERLLAIALMGSTLLGPLGAGHYAFPFVEAILFGTWLY